MLAHSLFVKKLTGLL